MCVYFFHVECFACVDNAMSEGMKEWNRMSCRDNQRKIAHEITENMCQLNATFTLLLLEHTIRQANAMELPLLLLSLLCFCLQSKIFPRFILNSLHYFVFFSCYMWYQQDYVSHTHTHTDTDVKYVLICLRSSLLI